MALTPSQGLLPQGPQCSPSNGQYTGRLRPLLQASSPPYTNQQVQEGPGVRGGHKLPDKLPAPLSPGSGLTLGFCSTAGSDPVGSRWVVHESLCATLSRD